jgi:hypothetical protein
MYSDLFIKIHVWECVEKNADKFYSQWVLESMSRGISYMKYENGRLTGLVTSYVETAF